MWFVRTVTRQEHFIDNSKELEVIVREDINEIPSEDNSCGKGLGL